MSHDDRNLPDGMPDSGMPDNGTLAGGTSGRGRELVPESWRELDDTLADGPAPMAVPPDAKAWLAEQRFVHGLLRALHSPDVAAREGRVAAILGAIDRERLRSPRRHWFAVAAAALLMACTVVWLSLPQSVPTAVAAVERAVAELSRDVVREYRLEVRHDGDETRPAMQHEFELLTRPGGRFLLQGRLAFGTMQFGELRIGADGTEVWLTGGNGMLRHAVPMQERERLMQQFGNVLDVGYFDLHDLVRRMPADCELQVVGSEAGSDGRPRLRIEARGRATGRGRVHRATLLCDEASGMIERLEVEGDRRRGGPGRMVLQYRGERAVDGVDFRRPW